MSRSGLVVPNIFQNEGSGPVAVSQIDTNFATGAGWLADSSNGYGYWLQDSGAPNSYIVTFPSGILPSSLTPGFWFVMSPANTNTGTSVVTVNALPAATIVNPAGLALSGGEITANASVVLMYTGTNFIMCGACPGAFFFSSSFSVTANLAGYTSAAINVTFTANGLVLTLSHLAQGVPLTIVVTNGSGGSGTFAFDGSNPSGVRFSAINANFNVSGGPFTSIFNGAGSFPLAAGAGIIFTGVSFGGQLYLTA